MSVFLCNWTSVHRMHTPSFTNQSTERAPDPKHHGMLQHSLRPFETPPPLRTLSSVMASDEFFMETLSAPGRFNLRRPSHHCEHVRTRVGQLTLLQHRRMSS